MSSNFPGNSTRGRPSRRRTTRGKLRRNTNIDGLTVDRPFTFSIPVKKNALKTTPSQLSDSVSDETNHDVEENTVGEGCYVSCTNQGRRFYGVLVEQSALKAATELHFDDEGASLEMNKRMMALKANMKHEEKADKKNANQTMNGSTSSVTEKEKKHGLESSPYPPGKRGKLSNSSYPQKTLSSTAFAQDHTSYQATPTASTSGGLDKYSNRQVQKFRYVEQPRSSDKHKPGYRNLLATYVDVNAASESDPDKSSLIHQACESGGDFVGDFYYHYLVAESALAANSGGEDSVNKDIGIRSSESFHTFLHKTGLPPWYPLSNIMSHNTKILNMLQMHKGSKPIESLMDASSSTESNNHTMKILMAPRNCFKIGIVGGGLGGLGCAVELLRLSEEENLNIEVTLLEAQDKVGGRACTDSTTFSDSNKVPFPVDLGAGWIHGIDGNPLTDLAKEAGVEFYRHSDEVKILGGSMKEVDRVIDKKMGKLFDELLDEAAEHVWNRDETINPNELRYQQAVRWYASVLANPTQSKSTSRRVEASDVPPHRYSSDISIDHAIGIVTRKHGEIRQLSPQEQSLLLWNTKNAEYALGANICDLSMKFWASDESHAFKGDHVLLKQGYTALADHLLEKAKTYKNFECLLNFPVGKIQYNRQSTTYPYVTKPPSIKTRTTIELSDACTVTSKNGHDSHNFDFIVSAIPLGVLKQSIRTPQPDDIHNYDASKIIFDPPLPPCKIDSIQSVGFGLLNKVYLQFPHAFWRRPGKWEFFRGTPFLADEQDLFGNASGQNPHHYMFLDIGFSQQKNTKNSNSPNVLMATISGAEAVAFEQMEETTLIQEIMKTLSHLFSEIEVPNPTNFKVTRWGSDPFSRGSYTFLPPGASEEDYHVLQSPINANGDSLLLNDSEIMRIFFAGEHTTALFPSMAHGAYLSGVRAAKEVFQATQTKPKDIVVTVDSPIPLTIFRNRHPRVPVMCHNCHLPGDRMREGKLLAFVRGTKQVLVHKHCAAFSPEVEVFNENWRNVFRSVNRGRNLHCSLCKKSGATIGCMENACRRSYHFGCCEDTGWNFENNGKGFLCDSHRLVQGGQKNESDNTISINFFRSKNPNSPVECQLCSIIGEDDRRGRLLGFQRDNKQILVHSNCLKYSNVVHDMGGTWEEDSETFQNVFECIVTSKGNMCEFCTKFGASVKCSECEALFHFPCTNGFSWNYKNEDEKFVCNKHSNIHSSEARQGSVVEPIILDDEDEKSRPPVKLKHDLFMTGSAKAVLSAPISSSAASLPATPVVAVKPEPVPKVSKTPAKGSKTPAKGSKTPAKGSKTVTKDPEPPMKPEPQSNSSKSSTKAEPKLNDAKPVPNNLEPQLNNNTLSGKNNDGVLKSNNDSDVDIYNNNNNSDEDFEYDSSDAESGEEETDENSNDEQMMEPFDIDPHIADEEIGRSHVIHERISCKRKSTKDPWNIYLSVNQQTSKMTSTLRVQSKDVLGMKKGDIIISVDGIKVGSPKLLNVEDVVNYMSALVEMYIELIRKPKK